MKPDAPSVRGYAAAVLAPFFIALAVMVAKRAGAIAPGLLITAYSALMSVPMLLAWQLLRRQDLELAKLFGEVRRPFLQLLITRSIFGSALIVVGFTLTTALKSILLLRLEALFVFVWSVFLGKEKPAVGKILLITALLAGSVLVVLPTDAQMSGLNLGDGLIVLSLLLMSFSYIPTETVVRKVSPTNVNIVANTIGGIVVLTVACFVVPSKVLTLSPQALSLIFSYALLFSVIGVNLYYFAFKTIKPWIIACFLSLEVIYGVPLAWIMLGEVLTPLQTLGALIVMAATTGIGLLHLRRSE